MDWIEVLDWNLKRLEAYDICKHLCSSTTSDVFLVVQRKSKQFCVLKQVSLWNMCDEDRFRVEQEIIALSSVDHPNVVKFRESFSGENSVNIVMEYCEGGTLEHMIERQRCEGRLFPEDVLIEWMEELLCALVCIHAKRILHRDIKPSNIFVTGKNHLKLGDFGLCATLTETNPRVEGTVGTPMYFAPETCIGEAYDKRSDVWSLGVVFYEMCTLRHPFESDNLFDLMHKILTVDVAPFGTALPLQFEEVVCKMLRKALVDRPTAQELINMHMEVSVSHPSHPSQNPSHSRRLQHFFGPVLRYSALRLPETAGEGMKTFSTQKTDPTTICAAMQLNNPVSTAVPVAQRIEQLNEFRWPPNEKSSIMKIPSSSCKVIEGKETGWVADALPRAVVLPLYPQPISSFLKDIAAVVEKHSAGGQKIKLEHLDDAMTLLSQYKLRHHGWC